MPSTYTLISSNVLSSSAASVTFSAIPATFTDLVLRISARLDAATSDSTIKMFTNVSGSIYSVTQLRGFGSNSGSTVASNGVSWEKNSFNAATSTSNTFSSAELYIPNYAGSTNKPASFFQVFENNSATTNLITVNANLLSSTTAITSITFENYSPANFVSGSSFYLYGIKNS